MIALRFLTSRLKPTKKSDLSARRRRLRWILQDLPTMKPVLFLATLMTVLPAVASAQDADAALSTFFKSYLEAELKRRPVMATQLGDHRYDHRMEDVSAAARAERAAEARKTLAALPKQVDYQKLSRSAQIDFE